MSRSCEWVRARLARFLDRALPADEHAAAEAHLRGCAECRAQLEAVRETDRLIRDATITPPSRTEADAEARSLAELQAAMARRYDLDAAAQARAREMAAEQAGAPRRAMSPEEIANVPLDRAIRREATPRPARGFSLRDLRARLSLPAPAWRWMAIGVPAAAAAVVAVVLLVREPALHEAALDRALSSATREAPATTITPPSPTAPTPTPAAPPAVPPAAPAAPTVTTTDKLEKAVAPSPAEPAAEQAKAPSELAAQPAQPPAPQMAEQAAPEAQLAKGSTAETQPTPAKPAAEPLRMHDEAVPSAGVQAGAPPAPAPAAEAYAAAPPPTAAPVAEGEPWTTLRAFVESTKKDDAAQERRTIEAEAEPDPMELLLAAEDQLVTLASTAAAANAAERSRTSEKSEPAKSGGGLLGRLSNLRSEHPERTALREEGRGESRAASETRRAAQPPPVRLWLALADGWYLLYHYEAASPDAPSLAARALVAYEQAAYVPDSLSDEEQARVHDRIAELKDRSRQR